MRPPVQLTLLALAAQLAVTTGCAAIFTGTKQDVYFTSDPPGATIEIDNKVITTPAELRLGMHDGLTGIAALEGYQDRRFTVNKEFEVIAALDIFGPWFITFGIDILSGAMFKLEDAVHIRLRPLPEAGTCCGTWGEERRTGGEILCGRIRS